MRHLAAVLGLLMLQCTCRGQWSQLAPPSPFARLSRTPTATDGHAKVLLRDIGGKMEQVGLKLHPDKTQIVYCQDARAWRRQRFDRRSFTFLAYTFAPRPVRMPDGREFIGFNPAVSQVVLKAMGSTIRRWRLHRKTGGSLQQRAAWLNPIIRGARRCNSAGPPDPNNLATDRTTAKCART